MSDNSVPGQSASVPEAPPAPAAAPLGAFDLLLASGSAVSMEETVEDATARPLDPPATAGSPGAPGLSRSASLGLERHETVAAPRPGIVDWVALALSIIAPPLGILAAIAAILLGIRNNGFAATVAKIALVIGIVLSLVLGVALFLINDVQKKQAAHDAIVASSVQYCTQLKASPGTLSSPTFGFPGEQDTITDSIASIQKYEDFWKGLVKVAPAGIKHGTQSVETTANHILSSVTTSRVFDDTGNAAQMQQAVSNSGITDWVSSYCK